MRANPILVCLLLASTVALFVLWHSNREADSRREVNTNQLETARRAQSDGREELVKRIAKLEGEKRWLDLQLREEKRVLKELREADEARPKVFQKELAKVEAHAKDLEWTRESMRRALFDAGADAVPILVASMREHRDSAGWALPLLGDLGSKAEAAIPFVRELAALGAENIRGKAAAAALEKIRAAIAAENK